MKLRTIGLISTLVLGLLVAALSAEAQQAGKVYRVGWLRFSPRPPTGATHVAFRQKLHELGYVEGQNLVLEYRSAKGKRDRRAEAAAELVRLKDDVIVVSPAPPLIRAAQRATRTIPILSMLILLRMDLSTASQGLVATLPESLTLNRRCTERGWSYSKRRFREFPVRPSSGLDINKNMGRKISRPRDRLWVSRSNPWLEQEVFVWTSSSAFSLQSATSALMHL